MTGVGPVTYSLPRMRSTTELHWQLLTTQTSLRQSAWRCQHLWVQMDSNHRRQEPTDLQSVPFGHSGMYPNAFASIFLSLLSDSNQRPRDYKSRALAN